MERKLLLAARSGAALQEGRPHAAGVVALIWSTGLYTTPAEVRAQLTSTCFDLGPSGRDIEFGFGIVDADAATVNVVETKE